MSRKLSAKTKMDILAASCAALDRRQPTGEQNVCSCCGDSVVVAWELSWEDGDWCYRCWAKWGETVAAALPTILPIYQALLKCHNSIGCGCGGGYGLCRSCRKANEEADNALASS